VLLTFRLPGRLTTRASIRTSSTIAGAALGAAGFFVIQVADAFLRFALGVCLAERITAGTGATAWSSTRHTDSNPWG
jgi:hypothetical protein